MVHLRLNDPDTSRNELINYITALPQYPNHEQARKRLCQLAAQVKPVMRQHGFQINSLEEFEWNREFAGRNWNNGETVELVLRRQDGSFAPLQWVLMVFCHELAHIKHMNHIPSLHGKLDRELRQHCKDLQARGYYGDGFWSAGQRLEDNVFVSGSGMNSLEGLPEYSCGGAYRRPAKAKRTTGRRSGLKRKRGFRGPSLHTGAQTAPNTKGGRRTNRDMPGQGSRVDSLNFIPTASATSRTYKDDPNSTFRKRATSQMARELRAEAAMKRFGAMKQERKEEVVEVKEDPLGPEVKSEPGRRKGRSVADMLSPTASSPSSSKVKLEPHPTPPAGSDSDSETEDEAERYEPNDGFVIIDDDSSGAEENETKAHLAGLVDRNSPPVSPGSEPSRASGVQTQASNESEAQRRERARLYRQHERTQAQAQGGYHPRTMKEEWSDFLAPSRAGTRLDPNGASGRPRNGHGGVAPPSPALPEPDTLATKREAAPRRTKAQAAAAPQLKVKREDAIAILDSDDELSPSDVDGLRKEAEHVVRWRPQSPLPTMGLAATRGPLPIPEVIPTSSESSARQGWSCRLCTLLNPPTASRCEACETSRGSTLLGH